MQEKMTVEQKLAAQVEYCRVNKLPLFVPANGICWKCNKQIFDAIGDRRASTELITGCPYCSRSFCD